MGLSITKSPPQLLFLVLSSFAILRVLMMWGGDEVTIINVAGLAFTAILKALLEATRTKSVCQCILMAVI